MHTKTHRDTHTRTRFFWHFPGKVTEDIWKQTKTVGKRWKKKKHIFLQQDVTSSSKRKPKLPSLYYPANQLFPPVSSPHFVLLALQDTAPLSLLSRRNLEVLLFSDSWLGRVSCDLQSPRACVIRSCTVTYKRGECERRDVSNVPSARRQSVEFLWEIPLIFFALWRKRSKCSLWNWGQAPFQPQTTDLVWHYTTLAERL